MFADLTRRGLIRARQRSRRAQACAGSPWPWPQSPSPAGLRATIPAAFAREGSVPPSGSGYELGRFGPAFPATTSAPVPACRAGRSP